MLPARSAPALSINKSVYERSTALLFTKDTYLDQPEGDEDLEAAAHYNQQRRKVVQILKDLPNRFDKSRAGYDPSRARPPIPLEEVSDGHSHLTGEGLSESRYAKSRRLVEDRLDAYPVLKDFFHVDSGHSDLDRLRDQAMVDAREGEMSSAIRLWVDVSTAIDEITTDLLDEDLWVVFPERIIRKTHRTQTMEENYREINRVFESWCEELKAQHKRYKNKAYEATATQLSVAKATVERAVRFAKDEQKKED